MKGKGYNTGAKHSLKLAKKKNLRRVTFQTFSSFFFFFFYFNLRRKTCETTSKMWTMEIRDCLRKRDKTGIVSHNVKEKDI